MVNQCYFCTILLFLPMISVMKKTILTILYLTLFFLSLLLVVGYVAQTSQFWSLSSKREDWLDFAVFFTPIVSLFSFGAIIFTLNENKEIADNAIKENRNLDEIKNRKQKLEDLSLTTISLFHHASFYIGLSTKHDAVMAKIREYNTALASLEGRDNSSPEYNQIQMNLEYARESSEIFMDKMNEELKQVNYCSRKEETIVMIHFLTEQGARIHTLCSLTLGILPELSNIKSLPAVDIIKLLNSYKNQCIQLVKELFYLPVIQELSLEDFDKSLKKDQTELDAIDDDLKIFGV